MANEVILSTLTTATNVYAEGGGDTDSKFKLGRIGGTSLNGALRFPGIILNQGVTVNHAELHLYGEYNSVVSSSIKADVYGIKEVNTSSFGGNPFGRTKTTNKATINASRPVGNYLTVNVASVVNEILGQGSWASGNAMGFLCFDNGGTNDCNFEDWSYRCYLDIRVSAVGNQLPTPVTIAAPTFPAASDYGIRISEPGVDVNTATEDQLFYTSRKKELRILTEYTATNDTPVAHGLAYPPAVLGYYVDASDRIRIMNATSNLISVAPYIASNTTLIRLFPETGKSAYAYIFIDPLE